MDKWEYKIMEYARKNLLVEESMNQMGKEGWEAFHTYFYDGLTVYFKRKVK